MTETPGHFTGIDVFRGIAVAAMIVVNNPGNWNAVYAPLVHAPWNGWTAADLIFPAFVFVVGVALPLALARRAQRAGRRAGLAHAAIRAGALFACGVLVNVVAVAPHIDQIRVPGVLQRIALAFAVAAPIVSLSRPRVWSAAIAGLLAVHTALLRIPFAGHPSGTLTPLASLPGTVDAAVFGPAHLLTPTMDPEGLVGTLTTAATLLCGALAGRWLQLTSTTARRGTGLIVGGVAIAVAGLLWTPLLPLNKPMWTGSFALATAGVSAMALGGCLLVVRPPDRAPTRHMWYSPFLWLGANPLGIYILSEAARHLMDRPWWRVGTESDGIKDLVFWRVIVPLIGDSGGPRSSLVFALAVASAWTAVAGMLHRRGVRFRI